MHCVMHYVMHHGMHTGDGGAAPDVRPRAATEACHRHALGRGPIRLRLVLIRRRRRNRCRLYTLACRLTGSSTDGYRLHCTMLQPPWHTVMKPPSHTVAASITYGGRLHHIRLQPPLHRVAGSVTYGCRRRLLDGGRASGHGSLLCGRAHVRGAPGHRGAPATVCTGACNRVYCANRV